MILCAIIVSVQFLIISSKLSFSTDISATSECLDKIFQNFLTSNNSVFLWSTNQNDFLLRSLERKNQTVFIRTNNFTRNRHIEHWKDIGNYIIHPSDSSDLRNMIRNLKYLHSWNSHARFFITVDKKLNATLFPEIIEVLWYQGIYNFILIVGYQSVKVYTLDFYKCEDGLDFTKFQLLDVCYNGKFQNNSNLFPNKIPKVFNFCELKVGAVIWPPYVLSPTQRVANTDQYIINEGIEIRLIKALSTKLQLNVSYIVSEKSLNWGKLHSNGTGTGLMALLRTKKIDLGIASLTPSVRTVHYFEISQSYFFESLTWCVPHAPRQPDWKKMFQAITFEMQIAFISSFFTITLLIWLLSKTQKKETIYKKFLNCIQSSFSVVVGVSVKNRPKTQILRWIFFFWMAFSLHFEVVYETELISVLANPTFEKQINSLDEILNSNLNILFSTNILNYIENSSLNQQILKVASECDNVKECLHRIAYNKDSAILISSSHADYIIDSYTAEDNTPLIYCFPSQVSSFPVIFLMRKGFPLALRFNQIISHLIQGGFVKLWATEIYSEKTESDEMAKINKTISSEFLNLDKLRTAFICWFAGLTTAGIVFLAEIIHFLVKFFKDKHIFII